MLVCIVPCRSQLDEIQREDPDSGLCKSIRQSFRTQWSGVATFYDNTIGPHVRDFRREPHNDVSKGFAEMIRISSDERIKKRLIEANQTWIKLVENILLCDDYVCNFRQIATPKIITMQYAAYQQMYS